MIAVKRILVATDFGEAADAALVYGRELATRFGADLHVVHVAENVYITAFGAETYAAVVPDLQRDIEDSAWRRLRDATVDSDGRGPRTTLVVMTSSSPAFAVIDYAREHDVDLIVMGTHGRGAVQHLFMGSVAERVVRHAHCPVLTVRHPEREFVHPDLPAVAAAAASASTFAGKNTTS